MSTTLPLILLLAAGSARRMAPRDKLLEPVSGQPLLRRQVQAALATGARVLVTLPPDRPARQAALTGLTVDIAILPDAAAGMAASLRAGAAAAGGAALMVVPADMPEIDHADLLAMLEAHAADPQRILRGSTAAGRAGHPVVLPADLLPEVARLHGDQGARPVLARHAARVALVELPDDHAVIDLDTPADWAAWRARHKETGPT